MMTVVVMLIFLLVLVMVTVMITVTMVLVMVLLVVARGMLLLLLVMSYGDMVLLLALTMIDMVMVMVMVGVDYRWSRCDGFDGGGGGGTHSGTDVGHCHGDNGAGHDGNGNNGGCSMVAMVMASILFDRCCGCDCGCGDGSAGGGTGIVVVYWLAGTEARPINKQARCVYGPCCQVAVCSACSGHGYKFASVIGEILAELATTGDTQHDISLHRIANPSRTGALSVWKL